MRDLTTRRPTHADLHAVGELLRARDIARVGMAEFTDEELAHDWSTPGFDLAQDAWLVEDGGVAVAYADLLPDEPGTVNGETVTATGYAHLEPTLLDLVEARAADRAGAGAPALVRVAVVDVEHERAGRCVEAGYRRVRTFLRMRLEPDAPTPDHPWPAGVDPVPFDPEQHAVQANAVLRAAFTDHVAVGRPGPYEEWRHEVLDHPCFDPSCWVLAYEHEQLVGVVVGIPEPDAGWIKSLGVLPEARGRGMAAAMLAEAVRRLRATGRKAVELGVDAESLTGATRLYERAGMHVVRRTDIYEKALPPSA